jgi:TonB family C-terminal domain/TonB family C-terminal domain
MIRKGTFSTLLVAGTLLLSAHSQLGTQCQAAAPAKGKAPAGKKPAGGGMSEEAYMNNIQEKIGKTWHPPEVKEAGKITVVIPINKKGEVGEVQVKESCGNKETDDLAVKSVKDAAPFGALPAVFKDGLNLTYSFQLQPNIDVDPYMDKLSDKVNSVWHPPVVARNAKVVVHFTVDKAGVIKELKIKQPSGFKILDDQGQAAIRKAAPFGELPAGVDALPVDFTLAAGPKGASVEKYKWNGVPLPKAGWQVSRGGATLRPLDVDTKIDNQLKAREFAIQDRIDKLVAAMATETDKAKKAQMLLEIGQRSTQIKNLDKAKEHLEQAAAIESELNPGGAGLGKVLASQAEVAALAGDNDKSTELYEKALENLRKNVGTAGNTAILIKTIEDYAKVLYKQNKVDRANELYAELKTLKSSQAN